MGFSHSGKSRHEQHTWRTQCRHRLGVTQQWPELTFEEDKLALAVLVHGVDLCRQAPPEHTDEHRVSRHDRVVPHPPKPVVLEETCDRMPSAKTKKCRIRYDGNAPHWFHTWILVYNKNRVQGAHCKWQMVPSDIMGSCLEWSAMLNY